MFRNIYKVCCAHLVHVMPLHDESHDKMLPWWHRTNLCAYSSELCVGYSTTEWVRILYVQGICYFNNFMNLQNASEVVGLDIWL